MKFLKLLAITAMLLAVSGTPPARAGSPGGTYYGPVSAELASPPRAEASVARAKWKKRWIATWLAVAALNSLDIQSSRGHGEANPWLRGPSGRFSTGKAILLKSAVGGGVFATEWWIVSRNPHKDYYKPFTVLNCAVAGGLAGIVVHNYSLPPAKAASTVPAAP